MLTYVDRPRELTDVNRNGLNYYTLPRSWVEAQYDQTVLYSIVEPCPYSSRFFTCVATVWNHRRNQIEPLAFIWKQDSPESLSWMDCNHTQPIFFWCFWNRWNRLSRERLNTRGSAKISKATRSWPPGQVTYTWGRHLRTAKATWSHLQLGK